MCKREAIAKRKKGIRHGGMGSREKEQLPPAQPLLSSLVIRPSNTDGTGGSASDFDTSRDPSPGRFPDDPEMDFVGPVVGSLCACQAYGSPNNYGVSTGE